MGLSGDLERVAEAVAGRGAVSGVLAAEPVSGRRAYLIAFGEGESREWLVVDESAAPVDERELVREVASIVVMCELAEELAGGGDLEELRGRLAQVRLVEQPSGIEEAERAALALERAVGAPPRVACPAYLDAVGAAARELEQALGHLESPFARALTSSAATVEAFVGDVETRYQVGLR